MRKQGMLRLNTRDLSIERLRFKYSQAWSGVSNSGFTVAADWLLESFINAPWLFVVTKE